MLNFLLNFHCAIIQRNLDIGIEYFLEKKMLNFDIFCRDYNKSLWSYLHEAIKALYYVSEFKCSKDIRHHTRNHVYHTKY